MTLNVTYLVNVYPAGSHTFIRREIQALERQGITIQRIALRGWDGELVDAADRDERSRTRYVMARGTGALATSLLLSMLQTPFKLLRAARLAWRMARTSDRAWPVHLAYLAEACVVRRWMQASNATHLHAHFATNSAEIAMLARALGGPPYSFTAHGSDITDRPAQVGLPLTVSNAAFVVAVCSFGRSQIFRWTSHTLWDRVKVVRCGVPPGYGLDGNATTQQRARLLCVGRLSKEKGQLLLIHAARILADADIEFELVLAGDGPMRGEIEALTSSLGLKGHVRLLGWLDAHGIEQQIRLARGLVVPSLSEGLPVVILEAMSHGRPVVAPYLAGIPELVKEGRNGWLFPAGDVEALAAAMRACLHAADDELLRMSRAARADVRTAHDIDTEAEKLADLFQRSAVASQ